MSYVDIMKTDDGWFFCANWCGREVTVRGNFCAHCSWVDEFMCVDGQVPMSEQRIEIHRHEMSAPYRGTEIILVLDKEGELVV